VVNDPNLHKDVDDTLVIGQPIKSTLQDGYNRDALNGDKGDDKLYSTSTNYDHEQCDDNRVDRSITPWKKKNIQSPSLFTSNTVTVIGGLHKDNNNDDSVKPNDGDNAVVGRRSKPCAHVGNDSPSSLPSQHVVSTDRTFSSTNGDVDHSIDINNVEDDDFDHDDMHNDDDTTKGDVIASKYGTENVGIAEGVTFSSASSIFLSNIAKAPDIKKVPLVISFC